MKKNTQAIQWGKTIFNVISAPLF